MPRLTPQLIDEAIERTNPLFEREIILRGLKFSIIENLGIGLDAYDAYDMSDNDITKFDGFPILKKASYFYCNNNRISFIAGDLHIKLPNLKEISLINNDIRSFSDIKRLEKCKQLKTLSLTRNAITLQENYRLFTIYSIPSLRYLDFNRIREKERQDAKRMFEETEAGVDFVKQIAARVKEEKETILFDDNEASDEEMDEHDEQERRERIREKERMFDAEFKPSSDANDKLKKIDDEQREIIKKAILNSTSIEEVERLNKMLQAGYIPE